MTIYSPADEVRRVAQRVIDRYHPELRAIRIEYVFRDKAAKRRGRRVLGTAKKVTGVNALLATNGAQSSEDLDFFLVTIAHDWWIAANDHQRTALVDHELEHLVVEHDSDGTKLYLRGHDLEAFISEIPRHGLWRDDIEMFVTSLPAEQLEFLSSPRSSDDTAVTITHTRTDGTATTVETSTGEISAAAEVLRNGSGILDADRARSIAEGIAGRETPGHGPDDPQD